MIKTTVKNLILFIAVLLTTNAAHCYVLNYDELYKNVYSQVQKQVKKDVAKYSSDFEIKLSGIPNETLQIQGSSAPSIEIISQDQSFAPNSYKRVYIKDSKNSVVKSFPINVQTKIYKNVVVALENIPFNGIITNENTKITRKEVSRNLNYVLESVPLGCAAKRNYPKGSLILSNSIKSKTVIAKNSIVNIKFLSSSGFEIKVQGHALKEGGVGDTIPVKSDKYNRTYNGKIDSTSQVTVRI